MNTSNRTFLSAGIALAFTVWLSSFTLAQRNLDAQLNAVLRAEGFTGRVGSTLEQRLGRPLDPGLADLGRLLWFDVTGGLHSDNTCGGCHSPGNGFGDSQSVAIGIQNNNIVGRNRSGPRNQRRTPSVANAAFYPALMWNGRFFAPSGDPFDNSFGYVFPLPEGTTLFPPNHAVITHLLIAQGHIPPTELVEVAGFTGTAGTIGPEFDQFDDGLGSPVPAPDGSGFRNEPIRQAVLNRLNSIPEYRERFGALFSSVAHGGPIDFVMFSQAVAEFQFTLTFANAPIDRFARGDTQAMTESQKEGGIIFFRKGRCVQCHTVGGQSNEMFSDFQSHVAGVPQVAPIFGLGHGIVVFDGPGQDEDFGLEQITGDAADRYKFRTSPLRNVALQAAFFHNGAFTRLADAIRYHLDADLSSHSYSPIAAGLSPDLTFRQGPIEPVLAKLDPRLRAPNSLLAGEVDKLIAFVRDALLDERAKKENLCRLAPSTVPSGFPTMRFEDCPH